MTHQIARGCCPTLFNKNNPPNNAHNQRRLRSATLPAPGARWASRATALSTALAPATAGGAPLDERRSHVDAHPRLAVTVLHLAAGSALRLHLPAPPPAARRPTCAEQYWVLAAPLYLELRAEPSASAGRVPPAILEAVVPRLPRP